MRATPLPVPSSVLLPCCRASSPMIGGIPRARPFCRRDSCMCFDATHCRSFATASTIMTTSALLGRIRPKPGRARPNRPNLGRCRPISCRCRSTPDHCWAAGGRILGPEGVLQRLGSDGGYTPGRHSRWPRSGGSGWDISDGMSLRASGRHGLNIYPRVPDLDICATIGPGRFGRFGHAAVKHQWSISGLSVVVPV